MSLLQIGLLVYVALIGLVVGSYLNVVIYRVPRDLSTVLPRSRCPGCDALIRARDNVPLISYLLLGGKCRQCKSRISWRYPCVEAATSLLFVASAMRFGIGLQGLVAAAFASAMLALTLIDIEHMILPDVITLPGIAIGLVLQPWLAWTPTREAWIGAFLGAACLYSVDMAWYLLKGQHGFGLGDVKMLAMIGAFLGWKGVLITLFFATSSGALVGIAFLASGRIELSGKLPFGAFLAPAALVTLFFGSPILQAYLALLQ